MKKSLREVASLFNTHPSHVILHLANLGAQFEDCWPDVSDNWFETVKCTDWKSFGHQSILKERFVIAQQHQETSDSISNDAFKIIDKLERKTSWASHVVPLDTIRHFYPGIRQFNDTISELLKRGYVNVDERKRSVSLNQNKKVEILKLLDSYRKTSKNQ